MNAEISFFLEVGLKPINKSLYVQGVGGQVVYVKSLLLDPWLFKLPGFAKLFHTHIFAPRDIRQTFLAEGFRMLNRETLHNNIKDFFDDRHNLTLAKMDRRQKDHEPSRFEEGCRKRQFLDHFLEACDDHTTLNEVQFSFYEPFPDGFDTSSYLCIREYRFHQYLRFLVGLRFMALSFSSRDINLDMMYEALENMAAYVEPMAIAG